MRLKQPYRSFEETLKYLLEQAKKGPVSIETFLTSLSGKGKLLLLIFLSLGFGQIPVIAVALGLVIAYLGLRIAIGNSKIWLPKSLRKKEIPSYILTKVINQILKILKFMKRWSKPRYQWATQLPSTRIINGIMISLVGISLALSPPVPLTGMIAYVAVIGIAIGLLNDDGVYVVIGYIFSLLYFAVVLSLIQFLSIDRIKRGINSLMGKPSS